MKRTIMALSVLIVAATTAIPAQANGFSFGIYGTHGGIEINKKGARFVPPNHRYQQPRHRMMKPRRIKRKLYRYGYSEFSRVRRIDDRYKLKATNPWGERVRLVVSAWNGRVLRERRIRRPRHYGGYRNHNRNYWRY